MLYIASVDNISANAYRLVNPGPNVDLRHLPPSDIAEGAKAGHFGAALIPTACLTELESMYRPVGQFGVACVGAVDSVRLFCRVPFQHIVEKSLPVYVSKQSRTSHQLFQKLYRESFNRSPVVSETTPKAAAYLFIGDHAVRMARADRAWSETIDLGEWWYRRTGLPFTFARWCVRRDLTRDDVLRVGAWLQETVAASETKAGRRHMAELALDVFGSVEAATKYYERVHARLTSSDLVALTSFTNFQGEPASCSLSA